MVRQSFTPPTVEGEFPREGYPHLHLEQVFAVHGPVHGLSELSRRSNFPPDPTADAEIAVDIMRKLGQLTPLAEVDYQELSH